MLRDSAIECSESRTNRVSRTRTSTNCASWVWSIVTTM